LYALPPTNERMRAWQMEQEGVANKRAMEQEGLANDRRLQQGWSSMKAIEQSLARFCRRRTRRTECQHPLRLPPCPQPTAPSLPQKTAIPCPRTLSIKVRLSPGMVLRPRVSSWVRASVGLIISAEATEAKRVLTVEAMVMHTLVTQEVKE